MPSSSIVIFQNEETTDCNFFYNGSYDGLPEGYSTKTSGKY